MSTPSLWALLYAGSRALPATATSKAVERCHRKLKHLRIALTVFAVVLVAGPLVTPSLFNPAYVPAYLLGAFFVTLFGVLVSGQQSKFAPLSAEADARCEQALAQVNSCKEAAEYRDAALGAGRALVGFDLARIEAFAEASKWKSLEAQAKNAFEAADAQAAQARHESAAKRNVNQAYAVALLSLTGMAAMWLFAENKGLAWGLVPVSLLTLLWVTVFRADSVDLMMPVWRDSTTLMEQALAVVGAKGPGAEALAALKRAGRSATRKDVVNAVHLDRNERLACKALHKVFDPTPATTAPGLAGDSAG